MAKKERVRGFSLSTYLSISQVSDVLYRHDRQIKAYAFIQHDKDVDENGSLKERHIHLLLCLVNASTVEAVRNWFRGFEDDKGMPINTLAQPMHDISSSFDYLTHSTEQAIAEGKYQYDPSEVISNNLDFFQNTSFQEEDNISLAVLDMCAGVPLIEISRKYGRDFIIHYQSIKLLFNDIQAQTGGIKIN